jgi:hypothetical protein
MAGEPKRLDVTAACEPGRGATMRPSGDGREVGRSRVGRWMKHDTLVGVADQDAATSTIQHTDRSMS